MSSGPPSDDGPAPPPRFPEAHVRDDDPYRMSAPHADTLPEAKHETLVTRPEPPPLDPIVKRPDRDVRRELAEEDFRAPKARPARKSAAPERPLALLATSLQVRLALLVVTVLAVAKVLLKVLIHHP